MNSIKQYIVACSLLLILFFSNCCFAGAPLTPETLSQTTSAAQPAKPAETGPTEVLVGNYLNQFFDISFKENHFSVDFYIWFTWKGNKVHPIKTFELMNGQVTSKNILWDKEVNGIHYAAAHMTAIIYMYWDVKKYPMDTHIPTIMIEDSVYAEQDLVYKPDNTNTTMDPSVRVPGWNIKHFFHKVIKQKYATNFGDDSLYSANDSIYTRYTFGVELARPGFSYYVKTFIILLLSGFMGICVLMIPPTETDARFGLAAASIFAAIGDRLFTISITPDSNQFTLADKLSILTIMIIFTVIFISAISVRCHASNWKRFATLLDRFSGWILFITYISSWIFLTRQAAL